MGFLAPVFLSLAALAAVPLLVHMLRRRINRTVDFPAVRYLQRMEQEHSRDLKLRNRLLMLLRILTVLAVAAAAARPIARLSGIGHAPISVAVVVDNSMSSGAVVNGKRQLDWLRENASKLLESLNADDRAWIVTADSRVIGGSNDAVLNALQTVEPLGGAGDMANSIRRAVALSASGAPRKSIVAVVTDAQRYALGIESDSALTSGSIPIIVLVPDTTPTSNSSVISAVPESHRWTPTGVLRMQFSAADSIEYRVVLDGKTVAGGSAGAGTVASPYTVSSRLASSSTGWVRGHVEIASDNLRADDIRHFAVRVAPPPSVYLRRESGEFLSAAVATLADEQRIRLNNNANDAITVSGADAAAVRLPALLTAPSDPVNIGEANRTLSRLGVPWRFGAITRNGVNSVGDVQGDTLNPANAAVNGARILLRYPLVYSGAGQSTVAVDTIATAGGAPWIVAGNGYVLVASPINPDATDLPVKAAFVPWLLETFTQRLGADGSAVYAAPGSKVSAFAFSDSIQDSTGHAQSWSGESKVAPQQAGVYYVLRGSERAGALVVNAEAGESDISSPDSAAFLARVSGDRITFHKAGSSWRTDVFSQASGRSLVVPLLLLAVVLLILESIVARTVSRPAEHAGAIGQRGTA